MKKLLIAGSLLLTPLALAGCQTATELATNITTATQTTKEKVKSVQGYAVALCGFLPTTAAIIGIFNSNFSNSVATVGNAICNAVTSIPLADGPGDRKPRVNGVIVTGKFVK